MCFVPRKAWSQGFDPWVTPFILTNSLLSASSTFQLIYQETRQLPGPSFTSPSSGHMETGFYFSAIGPAWSWLDQVLTFRCRNSENGMVITPGEVVIWGEVK